MRELTLKPKPNSNPSPSGRERERAQTTDPSLRKSTTHQHKYYDKWFVIIIIRRG